MPFSPGYPTIKFERANDWTFGTTETLTLNVLENPIAVGVSEKMRFASGYVLNQSRREYSVKCFPFYTTNVLTKQNSADLEAAIEFFTKPRKVFRIAACSLTRYGAGGTVNSLLNIPLNFTGVETSLDDEHGWEEATFSFEGRDFLT